MESVEVPGPHPELDRMTVASIASSMAAGDFTSKELVEWCLARIDAIDQRGPTLRALLEVNPEAISIADAMDSERSRRGPRGPLHGVPILLKDNIDTADMMHTTAGSLALLRSTPKRDSTVATKLRDAGAILLGKANMSEWAYFRSSQGSSGWSARGGQGRNPYVLDRSPGGSSSGSAQAVAASLVITSIGTETNGSIVCPSSVNGVVGIKPTVGLVSRAGVIPSGYNQDTVGPIARNVADAAAVLGALVGTDGRDPMTAASSARAERDYTRFLDPKGMRGARIGVPRKLLFGANPAADAAAETALAHMRAMGATIVDPADIPTIDDIGSPGPKLFEVALFEFKASLNEYLGARNDPEVRSMAELIAFNEAHSGEEMGFFGQDLLVLANTKGPLSDATYLEALARNQGLARQQGIDAVLDQKELDALVAPTCAPAWSIDLVVGDHVVGLTSTPAAVAGYPLITVPAAYTHGLPVNISFFGRAFSEPTLIKLAFAYETATSVRRPPRFLSTVDSPSLVAV